MKLVELGDFERVVVDNALNSIILAVKQAFRSSSLNMLSYISPNFIRSLNIQVNASLKELKILLNIVKRSLQVTYGTVISMLTNNKIKILRILYEFLLVKCNKNMEMRRKVLVRFFSGNNRLNSILAKLRMKIVNDSLVSNVTVLDIGESKKELFSTKKKLVIFSSHNDVRKTAPIWLILSLTQA